MLRAAMRNVRQPVSSMAPVASMAAFSMLNQPIAADVIMAAVISEAVMALFQRWML